MVDITPPKKKILIVEDEHDIRLLYTEILVDAGYEVIQASDGSLGLDMIRNEAWDLLLLDVILPVKDGVRILKDIRGTPDMNKGPIIRRKTDFQLRKMFLMFLFMSNNRRQNILVLRHVKCLQERFFKVADMVLL